MDEGSDKAPRRKRVSRACDRCRSKKDKCDGIRPTCSACLATGQSCSYDPHAKKRGLPEGYVRGLEKLWALSICNIEGFEDTMLHMLGATPESAGRREEMMSLWSEDSAAESLHDSWKTSRLFGALEKLLSSSDASGPATGKRSRNPQDDEPDGQWGFRVARNHTPLGPEAPRVVGPLDTSPGAKRARLSQESDSPAVAMTSPRPLQLPPQTSQLLDIYFAVSHSWFPVIAKHNILRASYLYANPPFSITATSLGSGDHAALWAILSYTVIQSRTNSRAGPAEPATLAKEYYTISRNLIPTEKARYELGHVQALLLLTLVNMGLEDWTTAWLLSGQAVLMATSMGLGALADSRRLYELRQGKAVFLGCFVIDSLLSFRLSRSPAMLPSDLATVGLLEEDGLEEWNSWVDVLPPTGAPRGSEKPPRRGPLQALSCFNRLVELASVLNRISRHTSSNLNVAAFAQQLVTDLMQWDDCFPLGCRLIGPESIYPERHSALLPHQSYLGLTYVATLLWLYRQLIAGEQVLHRSQRPATEGAKKLLYRGLSMVTQHVDNFASCGLPPLFEVSLRTIAEQAFGLRANADPSDTFPFARWADEFRHKTARFGYTWPAYGSLVSTMERWQQAKDFGPSTSPGRAGTVSNLQFAHPSMAGSMQPPRGPRSLAPNGEEDYTSSILGFSVPMDGRTLTPKDTLMGSPDLGMMDVSLHQRTEPHSVPSEPTMVPRGRTGSVYGSASAHQKQHRPQTPESSTSNPMMSGSMTSVGDIDAIFNDLAYLDTTEWATNREAGLKDFGFLDDSTFEAFCHDPDRLGGSQPLVHPPSIADIWPPPGFFPETFQEGAEESMGD
ncbi:transcriptional regulator family: Fungal Specific TF [Penicillium sp. DV-2018c]|nr:transcriptional regulator family: Fungal Specific TF [Penicillium sp. DV-2018c]KAJ5583733.1 transcriptional regulator family: Fungal Specific TF [Penicillium sp. DV-2018c]